MVRSNWEFLWLNLVVKFQVDNFDHGKFVFWPWSGSKFFDHMTMTPRRRPNGI